jgi:hypothetical protein
LVLAVVTCATGSLVSAALGTIWLLRALADLMDFGVLPDLRGDRHAHDAGGRGP